MWFPIPRVYVCTRTHYFPIHDSTFYTGNKICGLTKVRRASASKIRDAKVESVFSNGNRGMLRIFLRVHWHAKELSRLATGLIKPSRSFRIDRILRLGHRERRKVSERKNRLSYRLIFPRFSSRYFQTRAQMCAPCDILPVHVFHVTLMRD